MMSDGAQQHHRGASMSSRMELAETDDELSSAEVQEMLQAEDDWGESSGSDPCPWCDGSGRADGVKCNECHGTGIEVMDEANEVWKFPSPSHTSGLDDEKDDSPEEIRSVGKYAVLEAEELDRRRQRLAEDLQEKLSVTADEADCMLRAGMWNVDAITNEWINNPEGAREKLGIAGPSKPVKKSTANKSSNGSSNADPSRTIQCLNPMCDNDEGVPADEARALSCGHVFCNDCWCMHLMAQIKVGPSSVFAPCMGFDCAKKGCRHQPEDNCKCQLLVPERWFRELLSGGGALGEARERWLGWLRGRFVEASIDLQHCPSPDCAQVIADLDGHGMPAQCGCGHQFCFKCRLDDHLPVPCDLAQRFIALDTTDALTARVLAATTKPCPSCKAPTERNLACIHMTCSNCKHQYCWICLGAWRGHTGGYYSCAKYNEQARSGELSDEQKELIANRELLSKYQVYRTKHDTAKKDIKRLIQLRQRVDQDDTLFESKRFLYRVIGQLQDGFRLIQWSHCLTYFVQAGPEKRLFEFQQESLIQLCNKLLSFLTGMSVPEMCESRNRARIGNDASIVESQRLKTIDSLEQGQLIESIQNEADRHSENWACGKCQRVFPLSLGLDRCQHCKACKLHADPQCWACFPR